MQILELKNTRTEMTQWMGLKIIRKEDNLLLHFVSHKMHVTLPSPKSLSNYNCIVTLRTIFICNLYYTVRIH